MIYFNIQTGEYPRHQGDLELIGWKVGEPLPENWVEVQYVDHPEVTERQEFLQLLPQEENGIWKMQWTTRDLTEEEYQERLRKKIEQQKFIEELFSKKPSDLI